MIEIVVAIDADRGIGKAGRIPWHLPQDLRRFRELTTGQVVIMGHGTWQSLPDQYKPLPNRTNVVLSRKPRSLPSGVLKASSLDEALSFGGERPFVIGGQSVYEGALPRTHVVHLTRLMQTYDCDRFFPPLEGFYRDRCSEVRSNRDIYYTFEVYRRLS